MDDELSVSHTRSGAPSPSIDAVSVRGVEGYVVGVVDEKLSGIFVGDADGKVLGGEVTGNIDLLQKVETQCCGGNWTEDASHNSRKFASPQFTCLSYVQPLDESASSMHA